MLGAIHNGHNVIAKFHHGTNRGSINDLPDEAYLCLLGIDKRQINLDVVDYFQLPTQGVQAKDHSILKKKRVLLPK